MPFLFFSFFFFYLRMSLSGWDVCVVITRKWAGWGPFVLLTQAGTVQGALDCSQASCLCINPRHTLQLWPHWASIATVIQLPGRETCTASQADNNRPGLENSGLLLWCQQSIFLSLGRASCSWWAPQWFSSRQHKVIFREYFFVIVNSFWINSWHVSKEHSWLLRST